MGQMTAAGVQKQARTSKASVAGEPQRKHDRYRKKKPILQRSAIGSDQETVTHAVHELLRSSEAPDAAGLAFVEPSLRQDFSQIPVHSRLQANIQARLTVNTPEDIYEQEADRVANQVLATPAHAAGAPMPIQRFTDQPAGQAEAAPVNVDQALAAPSRPLEPALRNDMEKRFGYDFSSVRVHSDAAAEQSAREIGANAYTVESNIVFGAGRFAPGTHEGRRLLAHELTHVVQQSRRGASLQRQTATEVCPPHYDPGEEAKSHTAKGILDVDVTHAGFFSILSEFLAANDTDAMMVADFEVDSGEIRPSTKSYLAQLIRAYKPTDTLEFIGFSDCVGLESRNLSLRIKRARSVADLFPSSGLKIIVGAPSSLYPPTGQYMAKNTSIIGRALNRSVIIRHPKQPPKPPEQPEPPHANIKMEEPDSKNCSQEQRRQLAIAFPAARMMAERALDAVTDTRRIYEGEVIKFLLKRHFGKDALSNLPGIRAGFSKILNNWRNWESLSECELQTKKECTHKDVHLVVLAYVKEKRHLISPNTSYGTLHVCEAAFNTPWDMQRLSTIILHELSHRLDNTDDEKYCGFEGQGKCSSLSTKDAIDNADSYAQFAHEYFNASL
jgi:outer membrane protein OmpA-like peptidoglycan-associated protein